MRVAWIEHEVERGPLIDSPHQGAIDGPPQPYPTPRPHGRGSHGALLPHRRRLPPPQPSWRSTLRIHKAPCGLRGHDPRTLPTAARRGERTLFLARCREVFLAPVPRSRGAAPFPSLHRRVRKLRRFLEPLRRNVLSEMVGDPETVLVDSTLLSVLHPRQVSQGSGFSGAAWVRWGSFSVYGVKLHLICATNGIPLSYELTSAANVADGSLAEELLTEVALGDGVARRLLGDLAYNSKELKKALGEVGILLATERSEKRAGVRQRVEIALSSLKRVFGLGETLASTLVGLWPPGSRPRSALTPMLFWSTAWWVVL